MRGKAEAFAVADFFVGITPAYAGKRMFPEHYNYLHEDHPRLCGEKLCVILKKMAIIGSPPPMRGKAQFL